MKSYEQQITEQIEQFRETEDHHDLPKIFSLWSSLFITPGVKEVFDTEDIPTFYANAFLESVKSGKPSFLSLGCGDGTIEIAVARCLVERGLTDFRFVCCDLSEFQLARFKEAVPGELKSKFELSARDLNRDAIDEAFDAVMANHSLHHMVDLEGIFEAIWVNLKAGGIFVTSDMIGRNGHMRWPEAKLFVDVFWPFLTDQQRHNVLLQRTEQTFLDHDCSDVGFEGIRAQDVLPLILAQGFQAQRFFGFGGFIDPFFDRCFGHGFDIQDPDDVFLLKRVAFLNDLLLDLGAVTPTMMLAWFVKEAQNPVFYRNRSADASTRVVSVDPVWLQKALDDFDKVQSEPEFIYRNPFASTASSDEVRDEAKAAFNGKIDSRSDPIVAHLKTALARQNAIIADLRTADGRQKERIANLETRTSALERSFSWRITAPLRALKSMTQK